MPEFKIDVDNYDENQVQGPVKVLARCFNAAVAVLADSDSFDAAIIKDTVTAGTALFKKVATPVQAAPIQLTETDESYLKLAFLQAAGKAGYIPFFNFGEDSDLQKLIERADALFEGAVKNNLIRPASP